jgi:hypothetical protein
MKKNGAGGGLLLRHLRRQASRDGIGSAVTAGTATYEMIGDTQ